MEEEVVFSQEGQVVLFQDGRRLDPNQLYQYSGLYSAFRLDLKHNAINLPDRLFLSPLSVPLSTKRT